MQLPYGVLREAQGSRARGVQTTFFEALFVFFVGAFSYLQAFFYTTEVFCANAKEPLLSMSSVSFCSLEPCGPAANAGSDQNTC
jgi:hypothetical protein